MAQKAIDRMEGKLLPESEFSITCPDCKQISKFSEILSIGLTMDNNLVDD
jgi:phage FluMu protein Com